MSHWWFLHIKEGRSHAVLRKLFFLFIVFEGFEKGRIQSWIFHTFPNQKILRILFSGSWGSKCFICPLKMAIRRHIVLEISCYTDYLERVGGEEIQKRLELCITSIAQTNYFKVDPFCIGESFQCCILVILVFVGDERIHIRVHSDYCEEVNYFFFNSKWNVLRRNRLKTRV